MIKKLEIGNLKIPYVTVEEFIDKIKEYENKSITEIETLNYFKEWSCCIYIGTGKVSGIDIVGEYYYISEKNLKGLLIEAEQENVKEYIKYFYTFDLNDEENSNKFIEDLKFFVNEEEHWDNIGFCDFEIWICKKK